jgi:hypothetical protein
VFATRKPSNLLLAAVESRGQVHQATRHAIGAADDAETRADLKSGRAAAQDRGEVAR